MVTCFVLRRIWATNRHDSAPRLRIGDDLPGGS